MLRILITAVGSELAFAVIKAARLLNTPSQVYGCDIYDEVVGKYWCKKFFKVSLAVDTQNYLKDLSAIVEREKIDVIVPTADAEFSILAGQKSFFLEKYGCHILVNDENELTRFNDKWLTYLWLKENNLPAPQTWLAEALLSHDLPFPVIIKPRTGGGSRHIYKVNNSEEAKRYAQIVPNALFQEYLFPDNEEYTAGTYRALNNEIFVVILKRTLKFGMTNTATVIHNDELISFAKNIISNSGLTGSNNIQFRLTEKGPRILEINPRFSGTTGIRAHFGFNDLQMYIDDLCFGKKIAQPLIKTGFVMRFMEEQYHFDEKTKA